MNREQTKRPRKPSGRWVYYLLYDNILWPCPVRWEWESQYGGWLPFYYAPTFEFIAADPRQVTRVAVKSATRTGLTEKKLRTRRRLQLEEP